MGFVVDIFAIIVSMAFKIINTINMISILVMIITALASSGE